VADFVRIFAAPKAEVCLLTINNTKYNEGRGWREAAAAVLFWLVPALFALHVKYSLLDDGRGFRLAARAMGRLEKSLPGAIGSYDFGLSFWEQLSFFRMDALVMFVLVPLALWVLCRYLPAALRTWTVGFLSAATFLLLYIQMRSMHVMGRWLSWQMIQTAVSWGWAHPETITQYLKLKHLLLLVVGLVVFPVAYFWLAPAVRRWQLRRESKWTNPPVGFVPFVAACLICIIVPFPWLSRLPRSIYHESILVTSLKSLWNTGAVNSDEFAGLTRQQLVERYEQMSSSPAYRRDPAYWGKAQGSNVILFVLETAPEAILAPDDPMTDLPNLRKLRAKSFVPLEHYSTYPFTTRALFSVLTSWYSPDSVLDAVEQHHDLALPGIVHQLRQTGHQARVYIPRPWSGGNDENTFLQAGFQQVLAPPKVVDPPQVYLQPNHPAWMKERIYRDELALDLMKQDMETWLSTDQKFVAMYLPQSGHHPWPDNDENANESDPKKRARAILALQDRWLGELLVVLEKHHQLDKTLILVTGDHGIRSRQEDETFAGGMIDEYSFHVPLFLYAPQVLSREKTFPWITSHIDISPTLLDLEGISADRNFEQGLPFWNPGLQDRTVYLMAFNMFGSDGYYSHGEFAMLKRMDGSVFENTKPHFSGANLVTPGSPDAKRVASDLARIAGLQEVWTASVARKQNAIKSHMYSANPAD